MAALKALSFVLSLTLAAPALYITSTSIPTGAAGMQTIPLQQPQPRPSSPAIIFNGVQETSFLIPAPGISSVLQNTTGALQPMTDIPSYPFVFSFPLANTSTSLAIPAPITVTVTKQDPLIIPMPAPTTITQVVTTTRVERPSPIPASEPRPPAPVAGQHKETWAAPPHYSNLSSFKVTKYPGPERNLEIVTGIPAQASAHPDADFSKSPTSKKAKKKSKGRASKTAPTTTNSHSDPPPPGWNNDTSAIQIFYPQGSINPARDPKGGAEFYGSPIDISTARNVTFEYSVFFPRDFDWVKAGKLPGLYGGHPGCSGGNAALDCFSTRLMWRKDGKGELYLYAPKDKQTQALCGDPQSTCDAAYGLSIGRGSFAWAAGAWTRARQTVVLNTPGKTDGIFTLDVNGERVIDRDDVMYRDRIPPSKPATKKPSKTKTTTTTVSSSTDGAGLLGPIVSGVLGGFGLKNGGSGSSTGGEDDGSKEGVENDHDGESMTEHPVPTRPPTQGAESNITPGSGITGEQPLQTRNAAWSRRGANAKAKASHVGGDDDGDDDDDGQVKLVGIFFSTFFGGHEDEYATPRDQYAWFRDFMLSYND